MRLNSAGEAIDTGDCYNLKFRRSHFFVVLTKRDDDPTIHKAFNRYIVSLLADMILFERYTFSRYAGFHTPAFTSNLLNRLPFPNFLNVQSVYRLELQFRDIFSD